MPNLYGKPNSLPMGGGGSTSGGGGSTGGGSSSGGSSISGGGTYMAFDPRIGNNALPQGIQGTANRAYTRNVQGNELAQNQMNNITSQNSPLMRNAQMRGIRHANSRGMVNSSMAGEAAQNAVIESAMPMALQDSQAYQEAAGQNLQYLNQRDLADMQAQTAREAAWASTQSQIYANEGQLHRQRENLAYEGEQAELQRRYGFQTMGLENEWGMERDRERDYRQFGFDAERDYRQFGFENQRAARDFQYNQMEQDWNTNRDMRRQVYESILALNVASPEEMDEYINSGMMEYFSGMANDYFSTNFRSIYGY